MLAFGLALPVWAGEGASVPGAISASLGSPKQGSISGYVRSNNGVPQMGALVEVLGSAVNTLRVFTDENGYYSVSSLLPGFYNIKVSAPSFLPALREKIGLHAGSALSLNVTLNTLFDTVQLIPARVTDDPDDWKWVLRSAANRPILRLVNAPSTSHANKSINAFRDVTGTLSFLAGSPSEGFGGTSDMSTGFSVEKSIFSAGTLALHGDVGYGTSTPDAIFRASYSHELANGSNPRIALTMRHLASPDAGLRDADLQALALTASDSIILGDILELQFGSELQTIQFMGRVSAFRPFGSAAVHVSPNTVVAYSYATSEPDTRLEKGFDSAPADLSEAQPRVSIAGYAPAIERAHHHEVSVSRRLDPNTNLQFAVYSDRVVDPALTGVGEFSSDGGEAIPDIYSGTFTYQGRELDTRGMRIVLQRKLAADITATADYGYGGVLDLNRADVSLADARTSEVVRNRQSLSGKVSGHVPGAKTRWIASYGWVNGQALTPVDMFNASAGRADPYLNLFFKQPIPGTGFLPCRMEALLDVRNLLAQGYVPVMGQDGRTVYLVQSARAVRGGIAFTF
ncbi:MAG TPA: carboxypeptidase-like regulatory domain-containing protein [Terriglobales bacterium]|nr:carboxypeptidase-like regulatory domain-containing protein [Terriglobales bacterium]